jgi:uncharacterized membrane protein YfcA
MRSLVCNIAERLTSVFLWLFILALSLCRLTTVYHEYLAQFKEGRMIETATYVLLILVSLWFISRPGSAKKSANQTSSRRESLVAEFADGFLSSLL